MNKGVLEIRPKAKEYNDDFDILGKDRNGSLTRQKFGMSSGAPFNVLDKDGDNHLSRKEWEAGFDLLDMMTTGSSPERSLTDPLTHSHLSAMLTEMTASP